MNQKSKRCRAIWRSRAKVVGSWPCGKRAGHGGEHESSPLGSGFRWQNRLAV